MLDQTKLQRYSLGIAGETLKAGQRQLEVVPIERAGFLDGEFTGGNKPLQSQGQDRTGLEYQKSINTSNTVTAMWYPGTSNRIFPPTITKGEQVVLYRYADTDQFYWTAEGMSDHLRATDTLSVGVSAKGKSDEEPLGPDNSYHFEMSSENKTITLKTSQANGEVCLFTAQFNMEKGFFEVATHAGDMVQIDFPSKSVAMQNSAGSRVEMNGKKVTIEAPDSIEMITKSLIVNASTEIKVTTTNYTLQANASAKISSANVEIAGVTTKLGGSTLAFSYATAGASGGTYSWGGEHTYTGTISHNGKSIGIDHKHAGVQTGGGNTQGVV